MRAALTPLSAAARLLEAVEARRAILVGMAATSEEVAAVLTRPKFVARPPAARRDDLLRRLARETRLVAGTERAAACRDPADDLYLEAALAGGADLIVSDDRDLLALDPWRGVGIVKPEAALAMLGGEPGRARRATVHRQPPAMGSAVVRAAASVSATARSPSGPESQGMNGARSPPSSRAQARSRSSAPNGAAIAS